IAHEAVGYTPRRFACHRRGAEEFAPWCNAVAAWASKHHHILGLQIIDESDLELVRVDAFVDVINCHVVAGPGAPEHHQALVEWTDLGRNCMVPSTETIQHIRNDRAVKTTACRCNETAVHCATPCFLSTG